MEHGRFRFGIFEFDSAALELRRDGVLIRLQSHPAQVLAYLVEHADQVVSRDDLRKAVWGEGTFVDFEGGLNFCISQLRTALRDDSAQPNYIRTIPKRGYQFIAPVQRIPIGESVAAKTALGPPWFFAARIGAVTLAIIALATLGFREYRARLFSQASEAPILAVAKFDNETGDPRIANFTDALTDNVVAQLASRGRGSYRVVGNAQILRLPREQRDLQAIATSLNAKYVVLGQVQGNGSQLSILAHLIRLSDQTHIWVVRVDWPLGDALALESEAAGKIAAEFSVQMLGDPSHAGSFPVATH